MSARPTPLDARDRLLEYALEELARERFGGSSRLVGPDLVPRVRAAWERGQRGEDLGEFMGGRPARAAGAVLESPLPNTAHRRTKRPRARGDRNPVPSDARGKRGLRLLRSPRAAWAAALLLALAALAWWGRPGPQNPPVPGSFPSDGELAAVESPTPPTSTPDPKAAPATPAAGLAADRAADLREELGLLLDPPFSDLRLGSDPEDQARRRADLLVKLGTDEAAWGFLGRELEARLGTSKFRARAGSRALALAIEAPERFGTPLARALWLRVPSVFGPLDLVRLAERGLFEFERELVALVLDDGSPDAGDPAPDSGAGSPSRGARTLAAAWLVNRGDPRGLPALATGLASIRLDEKDPFLTEHLWDVVVAGSLLQATEGGDAWSRTAQRVSELIEQFERRGDLETAARTLILLEFGRQAPEPPAFPMAGLALAIDQFFGQATPPADWDDLHERLESAAQWRDQ